MVAKKKLKEVNSESVNDQLLQIFDKVHEFGDCEIISSARAEKFKLISDELFFEEESVYFYLTYHERLKKFKGTFYLTDINPDFIATLIEKIGINASNQNINKYMHDETLQEKFWEKEFRVKYNELMKYLRRKKINCIYAEKLTTPLVETVEDQTLFYNS